MRRRSVVLALAFSAALAEPAMVVAQSPVAGAVPRQTRGADYVDANGLTVERIVELGIARRPDLQAARERVAAAEGQVVQAGLLPNPQLDTGIGPPGIFGETTKRELEIGVSQLIELGGKRARRRDVARLALEQSRAELAVLERQFAAEVRATYVQVLAADRQLGVVGQIIALNEDLLRATEARLQQGDVAEVDLQLITIETNKLRAESFRTSSELETEMLALRALAVISPSETLRIAPLPDRPPRLELGVGDLTDLALRERSDLRAARLAEELGGARLAAARAEATPDIVASVLYSGSVVHQDPSLPTGGATNERALRFGVGIELPIFNRNQGNIATAIGERARAVKDREYLELTIRRDVAVQFAKYRATADAMALYEGSILPDSRSVIMGVRRGYDLGEFNIFDVLAEQRRLIEAETLFGQTLREYYGALTELERAVGTPLPASALHSAEAPSTAAPHVLAVDSLLKLLGSRDRSTAGEIPNAAGAMEPQPQPKGNK